MIQMYLAVLGIARRSRASGAHCAARVGAPRKNYDPRDALRRIALHCAALTYRCDP